MPEFDTEGLDHLLRWVQDGVVARRQLLDLGATPHDVRRMLRRCELNTMTLPGVYLNHTGPPSLAQREWMAILHFAPAALCGRSALPNPPREGPVQLAVGVKRRTPRTDGVRLRTMANLEARLHPLSAPPRIRIEHAAIDVASEQPDLAGRFRVLADVCQTRRTTASAIAAALEERGRVPHGVELRELLADLTEGACSVLEREYLLLERRHGLPTAERQRSDHVGGRTYYRDVPYTDYGLEVELDGRPFHDSAAARDRDHERDLDTMVASGEITVRLTYGQVVTRGCATIRKIATILEQRGWPGPFLRCPDCR